MSKFIFDKKETYSPAEVEELLTQHKGYVEKGFKDFVSADEYNKLTDELKPFKAKERNKHITSLLPKNANPKLINDILSIAKINDDMDDKEIKSTLASTIKEREFLQLKVEDSSAIKVETGKAPTQAKSEKKTDLRFTNI